MVMGELWLSLHLPVICCVILDGTASFWVPFLSSILLLGPGLINLNFLELHPKIVLVCFRILDNVCKPFRLSVQELQNKG